MLLHRHHVNCVVLFNHASSVAWTHPSQRPDGAVVLLDVSASMKAHRQHMRLVVSLLSCVSDVSREDLAYPTPSGTTALVDVVDRIVAGTLVGVGPFEKLVVVTDGVDTESKASSVVVRVDADGGRVLGPLPSAAHAQERNEAVANHLSHLGVQMMVVGIGSEVKEFLSALQRAPRSVRTGHVLADATPGQVVATVLGTIDPSSSDAPSVSSDAVVPASEDLTRRVESGAAHVAFGDSYTVSTAQRAVDEAIRASVVDDVAFKDSDGRNHRIVRGLVSYVLFLGARAGCPIPGAIVGSKRGAIVRADAAVKVVCNKTLSKLQGSLVSAMTKSTSTYRHVDDATGAEREHRYRDASHYSVSPALSEAVAEAMQTDASWCVPVDAQRRDARKRARDDDGEG